MHSENFRKLSAYAVIATATYLPLLVLPAMVGVLVDEAAVSESFAGWIASANFIGISIIALLMAFRMHRVDLRRMATLALALAASADVISAYAAGPTLAFLLIRIATGMANGAAQIAAVSAIARLGNVERGYGLSTTLQFLVAGLGCYILPVYSAELGATGMFLLFAASDLLALALAYQLPGRALGSTARIARGNERKILLAGVTLCALAGYGLFEVANTTQYTYLERLGVSLEYSTQKIGVALMLASLAGIPGAFTIMLIGRRFGLARPLAIGLCISIAGLVLLITTAKFEWYLIAGVCLGFSWAFCLPFIQTLIASLDPNGSAAAAGTSAATIGIAMGPGLAAAVVGAGDYQRVFSVAIALLIASLSCLFVSIRKTHHDRAGIRYPEAGADSQIAGVQP